MQDSGSAYPSLPMRMDSGVGGSGLGQHNGLGVGEGIGNGMGVRDMGFEEVGREMKMEEEGDMSGFQALARSVLALDRGVADGEGVGGKSGEGEEELLGYDAAKEAVEGFFDIIGREWPFLDRGDVMGILDEVHRGEYCRIFFTHHRFTLL